jgi:hypothetical protein
MDNLIKIKDISDKYDKPPVRCGITRIWVL